MGVPLRQSGGREAEGWEMPRKPVADGWFFVHLLPCQFDLSGKDSIIFDCVQRKKT
jgi:hypothetical protein